jgi:hypothetical protein
MGNVDKFEHAEDYTGKNLTKTPALGLLWDLPEHEGKDIEPRTFTELLRYGTTHYRQTRKDLVWEQTENSRATPKNGWLEP